MLGLEASWESLACGWEEVPDWGRFEGWLQDVRGRFDTVYAPFPEERGHVHHNKVGELARIYFPPPRWKLTYYLTYRHIGLSCPEKSRHGLEVDYEPEWIPLKLQALACYASQASNQAGSYRHFIEDLREYDIVP